MPPRLSLPWSALRPARRKASNQYVCPTCSIRGLSNPSRQPKPTAIASAQFSPSRNRRHIATISPVTAVDVQTEVVPENRELYIALDALRHDATNYVNLSRLELGLRGLQTHDAVVRVAVLGIESQKPAQELARVILADVLSEEAEWEASLEAEETDGKAILLRYGEDGDVVPQNPLLRTISIPNPLLREHNLEILISTLNIKGSRAIASSTVRPDDAILVPILQTPTSFSGRSTPVMYPVHKSLVLGKGIDKAMAFGRFLGYHLEDINAGDSIRLAITTSGAVGLSQQEADDKARIVDIDMADAAISNFRQSVSHAVAYEQGWSRSGVASVQRWLTDGTSHTAADVKAPVAGLVASILKDISRAADLHAAERKLVLESANRLLKEAPLLSSLTKWAEGSHTELRDQLEAAFAGRYWHKITWWKLFWRVDDVTMIASEVLERRWLLDAEKGIIFVAGRTAESGFPLPSSVWTSPKSSNRSRLPPTTTSPRTPVHSDGALATPVPSNPQWPMQISNIRLRLLRTTVPPLQALAQRLVLQTISTTTISTALSTLVYLSTPYGLVEAGAVAALGLVLSLRRMQTKWETARGKWESDMREEGRKALKDTEEAVRKFVSTRSEMRVDKEAETEERRVKAAVERVRTAWKRRFGSELKA